MRERAGERAYAKSRTATQPDAEPARTTAERKCRARIAPMRADRSARSHGERELAGGQAGATRGDGEQQPVHGRATQGDQRHPQQSERYGAAATDRQPCRGYSAARGDGRAAATQSRTARSRSRQTEQHRVAGQSEERHRVAVRHVDGLCACALQLLAARAAQRAGLCAGDGHPCGAGAGTASAARGLACGAAGTGAGEAHDADEGWGAGQ